MYVVLFLMSLEEAYFGKNTLYSQVQRSQPEFATVSLASLYWDDVPVTSPSSFQCNEVCGCRVGPCLNCNESMVGENWYFHSLQLGCLKATA